MCRLVHAFERLVCGFTTAATSSASRAVRISLWCVKENRFVPRFVPLLFPKVSLVCVHAPWHFPRASLSAEQISVIVRQLKIISLQFFIRPGCLPARQQGQVISQQNKSHKYPGWWLKMCPRNAGLCSLRKQAVDAFGGSARLSWSEPPSRSNLPKDPPSKTANLHKKADTDTRIIFRSCGTACSLQHFQRLTANFLLSVCLCWATNFDYSRTETHFYETPQILRNMAQRQHGSTADVFLTELIKEN